jgi:hypothetical protein
MRRVDALGARVLFTPFFAEMSCLAIVLVLLAELCAFQATFFDELEYGIDFTDVEPDAVLFANVDDDTAHASEDRAVHESMAIGTFDVMNRSLLVNAISFGKRYAHIASLFSAELFDRASIEKNAVARRAIERSYIMK